MHKIHAMVVVIIVSLLLWIPATTVYAQDVTSGEAISDNNAKSKTEVILDTLKSASSTLCQIVKDYAPPAIDKAKEIGHNVGEKVKEKAPEVAEKVKSGYEQGSEALSEFRESQQNNFMDWFNQQTGISND